jgi:magnesium transporter
MITAYFRKGEALAASSLSSGHPLSDDVAWIDMWNPSDEDEALVEAGLGLDVPTREEMKEIEASSRLYTENGALIMTATLPTGADTNDPVNEPITFILTGHRLVTVRYADPMPFRVFAAMAQRPGASFSSGEAILSGLLDAAIDRLADLLERVQADINQLSHTILAEKKPNFNAVLRKIGLIQALTSRIRESLVSVGRLLMFLSRPGNNEPDKVLARSFKTLQHDVTSLSDHASFLTNNINFLLDATLGMINIEQTGIIKIFSVAAVVLMPPTLVASIYGMNFHHMPELDFSFGYPMALCFMVLSAILPYWFFKLKGWL